MLPMLQPILRGAALKALSLRQRSGEGKMGMSGVSNLKARAEQLVVGLLATLLVLALSACSGAGAGGQEQAKGRPLPQDPQALSPGEYHSVIFKPPLSFKVGKGWSNTANQLSEYINLGYEGEIG